MKSKTLNNTRFPPPTIQCGEWACECFPLRFFFLFESQILVQNNLVSPPNTFLPAHFMVLFGFHSVFRLSCRPMSRISFVLATQFWWLLFFSFFVSFLPIFLSSFTTFVHSAFLAHIFYSIHTRRTYYVQNVIPSTHQRIIKFYTHFFPFSMVHVCR